MKMAEVSRSICIMDTGSLLFSFRLDCPPRLVIDRVDQAFDLFFPYKVYKEYKGKLIKGQLKSYDSVRPDIDLFFRRKIKEDRIIQEKVYFYCLKYVHRWFNLIGKQEEYYTLGEGEKHCIALGLHLSRRNRKCLIVMTDDFNARDAGIDVFACRQQLGLVRSLLGTMVFIYFTNRDITELYIRGLVNDYFNLNRPKSTSMLSFRKKIIEDIKWSCRRQSYQKCRLSCLTQ